VDVDAVRLRRSGWAPGPSRVADIVAAALPESATPPLEAALGLTHDIASSLPRPMEGDTLTLWEGLATLGAADLTIARVLEPHLDALSILAQARRQGEIPEATWRERSAEWRASRLWQVYAAEGSERLRAERSGEGWRLDGPKPWCSLADLTSHALVTAWVDEERRGLFAVDLTQQGVQPAGSNAVAGQAATWASRGLTAVRSTGLTMTSADAVAVGEPEWYLVRPGFAWGGAGVAAIWYGAAVALARRLRESATRREPDQVALMHLGAVDAALWRTRALLEAAAEVADDPSTTDEEAGQVAGVVRQVAADTAEEVLRRVGHALGPGPLTGDEEHARRVADLTVYLRQHHAERDLAGAGARVLTNTEGWRWW
jgi:alkylation response protein AidB-like acyl-CoA dehydrogenase